jgi:hypothetical protein
MYEDGMDLETEAPETHNFSEFWVANRRDDGLLEMAEGNIIVHCRKGDLIYRVIEEPGVHPDEDDPAGYRITHEYACELVSQPLTHHGKE